VNQKELDESNLQMFVLLAVHKRVTKRKTKRERVIELLAGIGIDATICRSNKGYWSHRQQDVMSWEFCGTRDGITICGGSWFSMTTCAKAVSFAISDLDEVYPLDKNGKELKK
jgi:hypothetical protein